MPSPSTGAARCARQHGDGIDHDLAAVALLSAAGLAAAVVFVSWPKIDLAVARVFVDADSRFWLARHPLLLLANELVNWLALCLVAVSSAGLVYTLRRRRRLAMLDGRAFAFIVASLAIAPGLIANVLFKNEWGRARPRQLVEFGGTADFTPALVIADQCATNCSFVAGDASLAFTTLALALLTPPRWRPGWIALAVLFGAVIGAVRVVQGAHFLSDVVFAGIFVALAVVILRAMILDGRFGAARAERAMTPLARRLGGALDAAVRATAAAGWGLMPQAIRRAAGSVASRRWWLQTLPGLRDFGLAAMTPPDEPLSSVGRGKGEGKKASSR